MHSTDFHLHCFYPGPCHRHLSWGSCARFLSGFPASAVTSILLCVAIRTISLKCKSDFATSHLTTHYALNKIQIPCLGLKSCMWSGPWPSFLNSFPTPLSCTARLKPRWHSSVLQIQTQVYPMSCVGLRFLDLGSSLGSLLLVIQVSAKLSPSQPDLPCDLYLM